MLARGAASPAGGSTWAFWGRRLRLGKDVWAHDAPLMHGHRRTAAAACALLTHTAAVRPAGASLLGKVSSWLAPAPSGGGATRARGGRAAGSGLSAEEDPDAIHIFTVASGHMYERLQKIMVLSVLRTTKCAPLGPPPPLLAGSAASVPETRPAGWQQAGRGV